MISRADPEVTGVKPDKRRRRVDVNLNQLDEIIDSAYERALDRDEGEALRNALHAMAARLAPWRTSERSAGLLDAPPGGPSIPGQKRPPTPGHGRNGAKAFAGAERVQVPNQEVQPGCQCPECPKGKVYLQKDTSPLVRFVGGPPISATVYELERLRCNLCGKVFTASAPPEVGPDKYDETAVSTIATSKYGHGIPFNRLEAIQQSYGVPLPASTQWELVEDGAELLKPAQEELLRQAAQGDVLHGDDTKMKVLEVTRPEGDTRTGVFTTGMVSTSPQGNPIALFFTGPNHSGENILEVLRQRASELAPPVLMCDGSSWPTSKLGPGTEVMLANCLAHGRRKFVELLGDFPGECRFVLEALGRVYLFDEQARQAGLTPKERLKFHQEHSDKEMKSLRQWIKEQLDEKRVEPNSGLGKAMKYLQTHWAALTLFLRQPGAPLDNNICERALKKAVLHRKNGLYYRTMNGADVGDLFMTLIHTCELNHVGAFDYLTELQRHAAELRTEPAAWMPWNYQERLAKLAPD
jgi:transposase